MQWTWTWANSRRWGTGRPGMLQSMGSQRVGHDWTTEQQQWGYYLFLQYKNKNQINHMEHRKQHIQVNGSSWIQHPEPVPWRHAILHCIKFSTSSPDTHYIQRKKGSVTLSLRRHRNQSLFSFGKWRVSGVADVDCSLSLLSNTTARLTRHSKGPTCPTETENGPVISKAGRKFFACQMTNKQCQSWLMSKVLWNGGCHASPGAHMLMELINTPAVLGFLFFHERKC